MSHWIGTSGWSYNYWHGVLYPHGVPPAARLGYYLQRFNTVEVNSTFYRWPPDVTFIRWHQRLPEGFVMTIKAPRGLTHGTRLYRPERWLARMKPGLRYLGRNRGVLLVQLAPEFAYDYARLAYFLQNLPPWQKTTIEMRHPSWHRDDIYALLEEFGVAYCVMSGAHLPCILRATAPFVYVRMHGPSTDYLYAGSYSDNDLWWWSERIREWETSGKDVYVYFNNDGEGNAVRNAETLKAMMWRT